MAAFGAQPKELKIKEKQDKLLKQQLEKEREHQLMQEIEKTEKERIKKKGKWHGRTPQRRRDVIGQSLTAVV